MNPQHIADETRRRLVDFYRGITPVDVTFHYYDKLKQITYSLFDIIVLTQNLETEDSVPPHAEVVPDGVKAINEIYELRRDVYPGRGSLRKLLHLCNSHAHWVYHLPEVHVFIPQHIAKQTLVVIPECDLVYDGLGDLPENYAKYVELLLVISRQFSLLRTKDFHRAAAAYEVGVDLTLAVAWYDWVGGVEGDSTMSVEDNGRGLEIVTKSADGAVDRFCMVDGQVTRLSGTADVQPAEPEIAEPTLEEYIRGIADAIERTDKYAVRIIFEDDCTMISGESREIVAGREETRFLTIKTIKSK